DDKFILYLFLLYNFSIRNHQFFQRNRIFTDTHKRMFFIILIIQIGEFVFAQITFYKRAYKDSSCKISTPVNKTHIGILKTRLQLLKRLIDLPKMLMCQSFISLYIICSPAKMCCS